MNNFIIKIGLEICLNCILSNGLMTTLPYSYHGSLVSLKYVLHGLLQFKSSIKILRLFGLYADLIEQQIYSISLTFFIFTKGKQACNHSNHYYDLLLEWLYDSHIIGILPYHRRWAILSKNAVLNIKFLVNLLLWYKMLYVHMFGMVHTAFSYGSALIIC